MIMAEEVKQEQVVEKTPEQVKEEPQYTEIQLKAIDQGWIPKEEFDGDPEAFIDAAEFVRRGELFEKIEKQSKQLKAVREALEAFRIHHSKVKENEYFNGLQVKFSYAITCHKSQGGQWNTVFIEQPYLPDGIDRDYIQIGRILRDFKHE